MVKCNEVICHSWIPLWGNSWNQFYWVLLETVSSRFNIQMCVISRSYFNSLAPRRYEWDFRWLIFELTLMISGWGVSCEIALWWMPLDLADDESTLVQEMAWCRQATSHYLNQCWHRSMSPYGDIRPWWVNTRKWIALSFKRFSLFFLH